MCRLSTGAETADGTRRVPATRHTAHGVCLLHCPQWERGGVLRLGNAQYAQATLRDVVGGLSLDELLSERDQIQQRIAEIVEQLSPIGIS